MFPNSCGWGLPIYSIPPPPHQPTVAMVTTMDSAAVRALTSHSILSPRWPTTGWLWTQWHQHKWSLPTSEEATQQKTEKSILTDLTPRGIQSSTDISTYGHGLSFMFNTLISHYIRSYALIAIDLFNEMFYFTRNAFRTRSSGENSNTNNSQHSQEDSPSQLSDTQLRCIPSTS